MKSEEDNGQWEGPHLHGYPLGQVQNEVHIGIVVVVGASGHKDEVVSQPDVLSISLREG